MSWFNWVFRRQSLTWWSEMLALSSSARNGQKAKWESKDHAKHIMAWPGRGIQFSSVAQLCPTLCDPWTAACQASLSITNSQSLLKLVHWVTDAIQPSSSVIPFSSCLQYFPASGSFPMSQFFTSGGQSIGVSASASVLPMNIQDWFPLGWTGWISLKSKVTLKSLLQHIHTMEY